MLYSNKNKYLQQVLKQIKFPFDKPAIEQEISCHIEDKIDFYLELGHKRLEAEKLALNEMGDATFIGKELNKQHNPLLGWAWKISSVVLVLFLFFSVIEIGDTLICALITNDNPANSINKDNIVYNIKLNEKVKIDDTVIKFTQIIYEKDASLSIFYDCYDTRLWGTGWSTENIGAIKDDKGNSYYSGTSYKGGSIRSRCKRTVRNFPNNAKSLIIDYNNFNRKYKIEIPLQRGISNE
ncbi:hypothetical protein IMX26_15805 [Clostridium sp. 'deep sea']|uniref:permease prefix domain 1-containing protein n=1 Tax=Clostridium sp. 'deep sea' TaxID=2779445 RepID=UPI0018965C1B|nr:permease prefix domain 1-containing protein [Clostridium sp. 'deep sea']QOR34905.1 hypothetical protein IMX26_15805 [Clostridium sp. 'deep sea']